MNFKTKTSSQSHSNFQRIKKIIRFIISVLMYSICLIMFLVFLVIIINFVDEKRNLDKGINKTALLSAYTIVSPSMVPNINVLDVVITKRIEKEDEIKKGDVLTFNSNDYRYSGVTVTHRVVNIEKNSEGKYLYTTKGDANNTNDSSRIVFDDIYGKVILRIPKIGYIQYFLSNMYGWIIIVIIPTVCIITYDIWKLIRTINKDPKKEEEQKEKTKFKKEKNHLQKNKVNKKEERRRFD